MCQPILESESTKVKRIHGHVRDKCLSRRRGEHFKETSTEGKAKTHFLQDSILQFSGSFCSLTSLTQKFPNMYLLIPLKPKKMGRHQPRSSAATSHMNHPTNTGRKALTFN